MDNFDLKKFLVENRVTTRGRLMFEAEGANLVPLHSVGLFLDTEEKTLHPMKDDGTPDLDPGMAVDMEDANKEEIMAKIDDADKEVLVSVSKELSETLVDADQDMAEAILDALGGEAAFEAVVRAMSTDDAQVYLGGIMRDHDIEMVPVNEATDLHSDRGYTFTQFYGGEKRGRSLQITTPEREYIQIPGGKLGNFMVALEKAASAFYNEGKSEE